MKCFEPIYDPESKILILGTFPSVKSRADGFYYAHPHNAFWRIIGDMFCKEGDSGEGNDLTTCDIDRKRSVLLKNRIALWDVCETCEVNGSADASIRRVKFNDIAGLISKTKIHAIFFNGAKAEELFEKYVKAVKVEIDLPCRRLPSTSPACAIPFEAKFQAWKDAFIDLSILKSV